MKIKIFIFLLILLLNLLSPACFAAEEVSVKVGEQFQISVDSNPSTGYSWWADYDPKYLKLLKKKYIPDKRRSIIVGAGGKEIFTFIALQQVRPA